MLQGTFFYIFAPPKWHWCDGELETRYQLLILSSTIKIEEMKTIEIKGSVREDLGKKATKALRAEGNVPCVIYGTEGVTHFYVKSANVKDLIYTPNVYIVDVKVGEKSAKAVLQDIQFHPVSDEVLHIDFLQVAEDKPVAISIPVKLNGLAEGVKAGGKLQLESRYIKVKGLIKDLPDTLDIDITELGLGKTIQVKGLSFDNLELLSAANNVVVAVKLTRAARGAAAAAAAN